MENIYKLYTPLYLETLKIIHAERAQHISCLLLPFKCLMHAQKTSPNNSKVQNRARARRT